MDYHMQFLKFLSLLKKSGLSDVIYGISFPSPKTWTIICSFWKFFLFFKNVDYHMQFQEFLSLLQKHGLSYAIFRISFSSPRTWTIICIFGNFLLFLLQKRG